MVMNHKQLTHLNGLQSVPLKACTTMYLYDNLIPQIEGMGNATNLKDLYLQNNNIEEITGIENCQVLESLHLNNNCISHLSGLTHNQGLRELRLGCQRIPDDVVFTFDIESLESLSWSLGILDLSMCRLVDPRPLSLLRGLVKLDISDNLIEEGETMSETLPHLTQLADLNVIGNPVARQQKYRQNTIVCCEALEILDEREVTVKERQYLTHVKRRMAAMGGGGGGGHQGQQENLMPQQIQLEDDAQHMQPQFGGEVGM